MGIRIVTDSASDLNADLEKIHDIVVVPLTVNFGSESFKDRSEITSEEFFNKLETYDGIPSTSQVNPNQFEDAFQAILQQGDEVLGIFISSDLSGTYNSAVIASGMLKTDKITLIDSRMVSLSQGLLVYEAAQMVLQGKSMNEIVKKLNLMIKNMKTFIIVDTLDYLRKGGRLSNSQAFIGGLLNLKPILSLSDGKLIPLDKVRGRKKALNWIKEWLDNSKISLSDKTIYMLHARDAAYLEELNKILIEEYGVKHVIKSNVGAVVGTHCGPGAIGLCFIDDL